MMTNPKTFAPNRRARYHLNLAWKLILFLQIQILGMFIQILADIHFTQMV